MAKYYAAALVPCNSGFGEYERSIYGGDYDRTIKGAIAKATGEIQGLRAAVVRGYDTRIARQSCERQRLRNPPRIWVPRAGGASGATGYSQSGGRFCFGERDKEVRLVRNAQEAGWGKQPKRKGHTQ
jgi:hypothetical protein